MHISCGICRIIKTEGEIKGAQGITRNLVDFGIEERAKG